MNFKRLLNEISLFLTPEEVSPLLAVELRKNQMDAIHGFNIRRLEYEGYPPQSYESVQSFLDAHHIPLSRGVRVGDRIIPHLASYNLWRPEPMGSTVRLQLTADLISGLITDNCPSIDIPIDEPYFSTIIVRGQTDKYTEEAYQINQSGDFEPFQRGFNRLTTAT